MRETQIDRDPALLLLGQAVGVDARQGLHQRRLAMVDVPGRADQEALHGKRLQPERRWALGAGRWARKGTDSFFAKRLSPSA